MMIIKISAAVGIVILCINVPMFIQSIKSEYKANKELRVIEEKLKGTKSLPNEILAKLNQ